jgi:large subunit ribosomal protein L4
MTSAPVLDLKGNKTHEIALNADLFSAVPSIGSMHAVVLRELANARSGAANSKTRAEVRGGGAKPWRQKGTGRARAGSRRSPLWAGGGVIFGPQPRDYSITLPKKIRSHALKSALAAKKDEILVVSSFAEVKEPKTKVAAQIFRDLKIDGKKVLLVLDYVADTDKTITLAARNIDGTKVVHVSNLGVRDLLDSDVILTTESALQSLEKRFDRSKTKTKDATDAKKVRESVVANDRSKSKESSAKPPAKTTISEPGATVKTKPTADSTTVDSTKDAIVETQSSTATKVPLKPEINESEAKSAEIAVPTSEAKPKKAAAKSDKPEVSEGKAAPKAKVESADASTAKSAAAKSKKSAEVEDAPAKPTKKSKKDEKDSDDE